MPHAQPDFDHKTFLRGATERPGIYRMLDAQGEVLYVGKAGNLKKRLASYFRASGLAVKTSALLALVRDIQVTVTRNEKEALILENNLIKELRPRYNILLRDDKSYPYIYVSPHEFPRLGFYRGAKNLSGRFFGPYPSAGAVRETLSLLQKLFQVRQCDESFFRNRSRPCLQYQIQRCTAPCVGLIDAASYQQDVRYAVWFLEGRSQQVLDELVARMECASKELKFEQAARYRDQIASLRRVQDAQHVSAERGEVDVIASAVRSGVACVQVFYVRGGRSLGNKSFYPRSPEGTDAAAVLAAFLPQYYLGREAPPEIVVSQPLGDAEVLEAALSEQTGRRVRIRSSVRGERRQWLEMAVANADLALGQQLSTKASVQDRLLALQEALGLDFAPSRLECFDISHTQGEATVASCVVFDGTGPVKSDYRRFNIEGPAPGDDYAALYQALTRRYTRLKRGEGKLPDVLFIDGGRGQLHQASKVLEELQVVGVTVVAVAKGPGRKPGLETLFSEEAKHGLRLDSHSPALHLVQQIRDEAHRFAITGHRQRRARVRRTSTLEDIEGLGPKRRQKLLRQFGGLQEIARAGVEDLTDVPGISQQLAQRIYDAFHGH
jgi:excinuclease ABC subunit C